jgi:hypothetical protein
MWLEKSATHQAVFAVIRYERLLEPVSSPMKADDHAGELDETVVNRPQAGRGPSGLRERELLGTEPREGSRKFALRPWEKTIR